MLRWSVYGHHARHWCQSVSKERRSRRRRANGWPQPQTDGGAGAPNTFQRCPCFFFGSFPAGLQPAPRPSRPKKLSSAPRAKRCGLPEVTWARLSPARPGRLRAAALPVRPPGRRHLREVDRDSGRVTGATRSGLAVPSQGSSTMKSMTSATTPRCHAEP